MKKVFVLIFPALLFTISSSAQTKRIALLSHGGKMSSLNMKSEGNFGETPEMHKNRISKIYWDSVFRADSTRVADSLSRIPHKPKADTAARQIDSEKPQQLKPKMQKSAKAGILPGKIGA